jgi:predicted CXXCH cytochrome family protein
MKTNMKNTVLLATVATVVLISSFALAATSKVAGGKHDFSAAGQSSQYKAPLGTLGDQVCIYCHTPHNAGQNRLLWNKAGNGNTTFRLYTSSGTLSNATKASVLSANSPSLICLSCHDGKTAMNVLHTAGSGVTANGAASSAGGTLSGYPSGSMLAFGSTGIVMSTPTWMFGTYVPAAGLGGTSGVDLTDDHPIGFSYSAVLTEPTHAAGLWSVLQVGTNSAQRVKLFGSTNKVECSSCHDPHVDNTDGTQKPFLVMPNAGSALCLSCHNK